MSDGGKAEDEVLFSLFVYLVVCLVGWLVDGRVACLFLLLFFFDEVSIDLFSFLCCF